MGDITESIDKLMDAMINLQVTQMIMGSLSHAFAPPSPTDAFSGMFQGLFQMIMPILMISVFMKMIEKLG